jgi:hypothetical protein
MEIPYVNHKESTCRAGPWAILETESAKEPQILWKFQWSLHMETKKKMIYNIKITYVKSEEHYLVNSSGVYIWQKKKYNMEITYVKSEEHYLA